MSQACIHIFPVQWSVCSFQCFIFGYKITEIQVACIVQILNKLFIDG